MGRAIRGFSILALETICGVFGLDRSTFHSSLWNIFRVDLDAVLGLLGVTSSLGGPGSGEKQLPEVDTRLMWTGAALVLFGTIGYAIGNRPRQVINQEKSKRE